MTKIITGRRRLLQTAGLSAAALAAPAVWRKAQAQSGTVNVWTYANFLPDDFVEAFQDETGIEVRVRLVDDQGKQFNLLAAEAPNPSADIVTIAGHRYRQFIDSNLVAPLDTDRLSNWNAIKPIYRDADWTVINDEKWGVPILSGAEVLAYNTEIVPEAEAESWDVMFDPRYEGQTAYIIQDMMSVVMLYLGFDGNMIEYIDDPDKAAQVVRQARDFLIEHKPMVRKFYDASAEVQQMFVNQDVVLAHAWSGPISKLIMDGFPGRHDDPQRGHLRLRLQPQRRRERPQRRQRLQAARRHLGQPRGRRRDDQGVRVHLDLRRCRPTLERAGAKGVLVQRGGVEPPAVLPRRGERHEV